MVQVDRETIIQKLKNFHFHMENYVEEVRQFRINTGQSTSILREMVTIINIEAASLIPIVEATVGKHEMSDNRATWDPWLVAFTRNYERGISLTRIRGSLDAVQQSVESTIGYYESKDFIDSIPRPFEPRSIQRPKIFIAHDGPSDLRARLELECWRMMLEPIVAEEQPSLDESVDSKVGRLLEECEFGIVLARSEAGIIQDSQRIPRGNVIDEISRIRAQLGDNYIILLDAGLTLPSNLATGVVYETFDKENFPEALLRVVQKLRLSGLI